ncbi:MAG: hypothetical protein ACLQDY_23655 [Streptosporangiaceae bacterium]
MAEDPAVLRQVEHDLAQVIPAASLRRADAAAAGRGSRLKRQRDSA